MGDKWGQIHALTGNALGLFDQPLEHIVDRPPGKLKVVAANLARRLAKPVDTAVALLKACRIPRQVKVEHVGALPLQVDALARRIGTQQDAHGIVARVGVEQVANLGALAQVGVLPRDKRNARPAVVADQHHPL